MATRAQIYEACVGAILGTYMNENAYEAIGSRAFINDVNRLYNYVVAGKRPNIKFDKKGARLFNEAVNSVKKTATLLHS